VTATAWSPRIAAVAGRFVDASNATLLATTAEGERVVYKPHAGERPLWDFPPETLAYREALTYEVSETMGLAVVPETVLADGPYGRGAVQRYVEFNESFDVLAAVQRGDPRLWPLAVLDVVTNNADRKLGHILEVEGALLGIDHGLTFHPEDKLRTVLWGFAGAEVPEQLLEAVASLLHALDGSLGEQVIEQLGEDERNALAVRAQMLLSTRRHPEPPGDRPPLPWPPY
jgi:uncharacterized repeat protein (TIGR03843 family)